MVNSFEGLARRIRGLWMAALGSRLGRCDTATTADSQVGSALLSSQVKAKQIGVIPEQATSGNDPA